MAREDFFNFKEKNVERRETRKLIRTIKSTNGKAYVMLAAQSIS